MDQKGLQDFMALHNQAQAFVNCATQAEQYVKAIDGLLEQYDRPAYFGDDAAKQVADLRAAGQKLMRKIAGHLPDFI